LFQLRVARDCGFAVPPTLVSQDLREVSEFYRDHGARIIVKSIVGVESAFLLTREMPDPGTIDPTSFTSCPAFYQANVPGHRHIRLVCFGDTSLAAVLESEALDWRPNLNIPIREWQVPEAVHDRVRKVLDSLDLEMGVIDIKETPGGELVWLEVNPQGQFLFLEAITNLRLAERFAEYLARVDRSGRASVRRAGSIEA
jgi:glutathione synthase/RimK-type ligase-like ATP-grasp enzyme